MFSRLAAFVYGSICYGIFLGTFLYAIGSIDNTWVPKSIDSGLGGPLSTALMVDIALPGAFAIQHSLMARQGFKRARTRLIPTAVERSTYVLFSSLALLFLFWQLRPIGGVIWNVESSFGRAIIYTIFGLGWATVLLCTFLIDHFDLFGMRQVFLYLRGRDHKAIAFRTPALYRMVRHPLYLGWLMVF